jgi:hypothetical protein
MWRLVTVTLTVHMVGHQYPVPSFLNLNFRKVNLMFLCILNYMSDVLVDYRPISRTYISIRIVFWRRPTQLFNINYSPQFLAAWVQCVTSAFGDEPRRLFSTLDAACPQKPKSLIYSIKSVGIFHRAERHNDCSVHKLLNHRVSKTLLFTEYHWQTEPF